jgi:hypothetical protein
MSGDDHDRWPDGRFRELRLNCETVQAGHVQIEDHTIRLAGLQEFQEISPGGKHFHVESG